VYKILGGDGKEYGPVNLDQLRDWLKQGRINGQTRVKAESGSEYKTALDIPELSTLFALATPRPSGRGAPPVISAPTSRDQEKQKGLAVLSLILGLSSFLLCLSALTGIPAVICGHVARSRARRLPARYGGAGLAAVGLVLGYAGIVLTFVVAAMLLPALAKNRYTEQRTDCQRNLRELGLALKVWALDHNDQYPFNVSTNSGGTRELCDTRADGFDQNAIAHFRIISRELSTPSFLVCPKDPRKRPAADFTALGELNVTYRLRTGTNVNSDNPQEILAVCPIDGNELFCDGNVRPARSRR
jgi:hypothetical protein